MEKRIYIQKQLPLTEREWTKEDGVKQSIAVRGFVISDGIDTIFAEAVGDFARSLPVFDTRATHVVQLQMYCRHYTDSNGVERYSNEARITKIV